MMRFEVMLAGAAMAVVAATPAAAQIKAGDVLVRARAIIVAPNESSGAVTPSFPGSSVGVDNSFAPEVDFTWMATDHIGAELILATTQHTISARGIPGNVTVGKTWVLPPTVTLQYHFMPKERFSPYVGAGLNATLFYGEKAAAPFNSFSLSPTIGVALQAGFDYNISGNWYANVDVKQIFMRTTAKINGGAVTAKTWLNPLVVGAGLGYKF